MPTARELVRSTEVRLGDRYGLDIRSRMIELSRPPMQLRVLESGADDREPVVFLHEAGELSAVWIPLWAALSDVRCVGVDLPGFGLSDEIDYREVDLAELGAAVVAQVADELDTDRVPVVANGLGGAFALWRALREPSSTGPIVLVGAPVPAVADTKVNLPIAMLGVPGVNRTILDLPLPPLSVNRSLYRLTLGRDVVHEVPDEVVTVAHYAMDRATFAPSITSYMEHVFRLRKPRPRFVLDEEQLGRVGVPVLLLWGRRDRFGGSKVARRLADALPDARLELVDGGHNPWLQSPVRCAELIGEFLDEHRGGEA